MVENLTVVILSSRSLVSRVGLSRRGQDRVVGEMRKMFAAKPAF